MIRLTTVAAVAALAIAAAPVAFAQSDQAPNQAAADPGMANAPSAQSPMRDQAMAAAPSADRAGVDTAAIVYQSSPTPADQAYTLKAGDPTVVSNAPIPDTKANRARYGSPLSTTGRMTAPSGN